LSGSAKTSALVLAPTPIGTLDFAGRLFGSWHALEAYVRQKQPLGLREPNPLELIVALEPASFGARRYDVISQTFAWDVGDQADEMLVMSLPFRDWSQDAIRVLEALEPGANSRWRVVVRAALRDGALSIEPVSILRPETADRPVFQLAFDAAPQKAPTAEGPEAVSAADDDASAADAELPEDASPEPARMRLNQSFSELNRQLVSLAEAGCQNVERSNQENFTKWHRDFLSSGLTLLAGGPSDWRTRRGWFRRTFCVPGTLLISTRKPPAKSHNEKQRRLQGFAPVGAAGRIFSSGTMPCPSSTE